MDACGAHNDMKYPGIPRKREVRMMEKKRIAVLFGGQSTEHEVSCMSVMTIIDHIDREQYDILLIGITKEENGWRLSQRRPFGPAGGEKGLCGQCSLRTQPRRACCC